MERRGSHGQQGLSVTWKDTQDADQRRQRQHDRKFQREISAPAGHGPGGRGASAVEKKSERRKGIVVAAIIEAE